MYMLRKIMPQCNLVDNIVTHYHLHSLLGMWEVLMDNDVTVKCVQTAEIKGIVSLYKA